MRFSSNRMEFPLRFVVFVLHFYSMIVFFHLLKQIECVTLRCLGLLGVRCDLERELVIHIRTL